MVGGALQIAGLLVGGIGMIGTFAVTGMPQWRVSAFIENNIIVFETIWEGLWMHCIRQANIRMQCKVYDSVLALSPDLQASRGLMCAGSVLSFLAFVVAIIGMKCTRCAQSSWQAKGYIILTAGLLFILSGAVGLIPVSWVASTIISDFYNPAVNVAQKRELGEALYLGWVAAFCLIAAGAIFCCFFRCCEKTRSHRYSTPTHYSTDSQLSHRKAESSYSKSQYV
ncbi:PREDICTED: claudin-8-like [Charadrius vociferus]|uniref:claudin-8-like n=1 Tax=Charadrius vociferus TaxID=50402 RepID=UPI0005218F68|nr:PREDICTED: claudin-8-like [Charadrius vociferus]